MGRVLLSDSCDSSHRTVMIWASHTFHWYWVADLCTKEQISFLVLAVLARANNRTTIHFVRHDESDFGIGSGRRRLDLLFRNELARRKSLIENDEDLSPQGIESLTLDGID